MAHAALSLFYLLKLQLSELMRDEPARLKVQSIQPVLPILQVSLVLTLGDVKSKG